MLQEKKGRLTGADREVLLHFGPFLATKWWIGQDHIQAAFIFDSGQVFRQGIGVLDIGRLNAMQNQVHDGDDLGRALLFLAVKCPILQGFEGAGSPSCFVCQVIKRFTKEASGTTGTVINAFANSGLGYLDHGPDEWLWGNTRRRCSRHYPYV